MKKNRNVKMDKGVSPVGGKKIKYLILYLFYVGVILAVGTKLGAFRGRSSPPLNSSLNSRPASGFGASAAPENHDPLPQGILVFDAELKQTTVHEGDAQAHFMFNFTNVSSKDVTISGVKTSCGCTTAELPPMPWTLPPHAKGRIPVTMNVLGHTGKDAKTVTINTIQGFKTLNVEANILPPPADDKMGDRERNLALAKVDRQAVFKGDCAKCHADPTKDKMGQELYVVACGICHEASPRSTMVPNLNTLPVPTNFDFWQTWISQGKTNSLMPAFAQPAGGPLTEAQISCQHDSVPHQSVSMKVFARREAHLFSGLNNFTMF
jgi:cytochrome c5